MLDWFIACFDVISGRRAEVGDASQQRRTCASLLVEPDVHPRVVRKILRHSQIAVTMDIYWQLASASTRKS